VQAIEDTKRKIDRDITRRRTILQAVGFIVRTNTLIATNKYQRELGVLISSDLPLLKDLMRKAPAYLRD
jgi:hypothetical protein